MNANKGDNLAALTSASTATAAPRMLNGNARSRFVYCLKTQSCVQVKRAELSALGKSASVLLR